MRKPPKIPLISAAAVFAAAFLCSCTTEQFSRNVYEGTRVYNESLKSTPLERPNAATMSYDEYDKERREGASRNAK